MREFKPMDLGLLPDKNESEEYHHDLAGLGASPTYLLLNRPTSAKAVERLIPSIATITNERYFLEPFRGGPPNIGYLKIFASIAILVLILALVNRMLYKKNQPAAPFDYYSFFLG